MVVRLRRKRLSTVLPVLALDIANPTFPIETGISLVTEVCKVIDLCIGERSISVLSCIADVFGQANEVFLRHGQFPSKVRRNVVDTRRCFSNALSKLMLSPVPLPVSRLVK
jgi:hypothetical protein